MRVGWCADDHGVKPLRLERRRRVGETSHLVLLRDLLQQSGIGFARKQRGPPRPQEAAQMTLPDAAAADYENSGFHPRDYSFCPLSWQALGMKRRPLGVSWPCRRGPVRAAPY